MSLLPVSAASQLATIGAAAGTAMTSAAAGFASLLQRAVAAGSTVAANASNGASLPSALPGANRSLDLSALRRELDSMLQSFREGVQSALANGGVQAPGELQISPDGTGQLRIAADLPQRGQIEQALNSDPQLQNLFQSIAGTIGLLQSAGDSSVGGLGNGALSLNITPTAIVPSFATTDGC